MNPSQKTGLKNKQAARPGSPIILMQGEYMNTAQTQATQDIHAFTEQARDAIYQAIFSRRDVRGQFLPKRR